ncbi:hypothetical protein MKX01_026508 [Papaver californicum]|nr:hypothetical protein MKX01_026508 [Papaver californicum]
MAFGVAIKFQCFVLLLWLQLVSAEVPVSASRPIAKPGCPDKCGNVSIHYPFGIGDGCFLDQWFEIICNKSHLGYSKPTTVYGAYNVSDISILDGYMTTDVYTFTNCSGNEVKNYSYWAPRLFKFTISTTRNKFIAFGCNTYAYLKQLNNVYTATKCVTTCNTSEDATDGSCTGGIGCCHSSIPAGLTAYGIEVVSLKNLPQRDTCRYGFLAERNSFNASSSYMKDFKNSGIGMVPVVIDWSIGFQDCDGVINSTLYACGPHADCIESSVSGYRCSCKKGYEGNPYFNSTISGGCQDIDECLVSTPCGNGSCSNEQGSYNCTCPTGTKQEVRSDEKFVCIREKRQLPISVVVPIGIGISIVILFSVAMGYWLYNRFQKRKLMQLKQEHFTRNGGLLLNQKITSNVGRVERVCKVFVAEELEKTTDNFNPSRIIGKGGYGTVFKGMLSNGEIVAIKKSTLVDENQVDQFINEVAILSQINHRNIVRLLGCCLETQVPLLVYEFVPNGTLSYHLHEGEGDNESLLSWKDRVRIASEIAGALAYLHSEASIPIYHRDIKTTNILLDEKYRAKVSDFGISRSAPVDTTHLTTLVQGTFGYLDPEYFHSSQFTDKSDVYSFGIVLLELLTGETAVPKIKDEEEKSLALYFIKSLKEDRLSEVLDARVLNEGDKDDTMVVGKLAERCLKYVGKKRPTMKEVSHSLEGLYGKLSKESVHGC